MERKELIGIQKYNEFWYRAKDADAVMDAMEAKIKGLEYNLHLANKRIKELENEVQHRKEVQESLNFELSRRSSRIKELEDHLPQAGKMMWVSVKERMPKEGSDPVLVYNDADNEYDVMWCEKYGEYWEWSNGDVNVDRNAFTHWMPLPKPPKEVK